VLKDDHFPGCQNLKLTPLIDGAPNFRQMTGIPVYGVAIPTVTGLRNVLDAIGGQSRRVLWHSLREEPLVYVNGTPFVLREIERPFSNLELTGITRERVEQMEARLREDVLHEAQQYGGCVLVSKELDDGQVVDTWTPVESVQTPAEVYSCLQDEGYQISYVRIPITDEKVSQVSATVWIALFIRSAASKTRALLVYGDTHCLKHRYPNVPGTQGDGLRRDCASLYSCRPVHRVCGELPDGTWSHDHSYDSSRACVSASASAAAFDCQQPTSS
jgi:hypothetical protein